MIHLRDIEDDDLERLYHWRREPEVDRWMYGQPPQTFENHMAWWRALREDPDRVGWIICWRGAPVGVMTFDGLNSPHRRAQLGWYIGAAEARGRGLGRAAQALGLDRLFRSYPVEKVWAQVLADNDTALRAQAAAGFRREGYMRRHCLKPDGFHDVVLLGVLKTEWEDVRGRVLRDLTASNLIAA